MTTTTTTTEQTVWLGVPRFGTIVLSFKTCPAARNDIVANGHYCHPPGYRCCRLLQVTASSLQADPLLAATTTTTTTTTVDVQRLRWRNDLITEQKRGARARVLPSLAPHNNIILYYYYYYISVVRRLDRGVVGEGENLRRTRSLLPSTRLYYTKHVSRSATYLRRRSSRVIASATVV